MSWSVPPMSPVRAPPTRDWEHRSKREPKIPSGGVPSCLSCGSFAPAQLSHQSKGSRGQHVWNLTGAPRNIAETICRYEGYCAPPPTEPGDYYYQPALKEDQFIGIKQLVNYCKDVVKKLNAAEKVLPDILKDAEWYDGAVAAEQLKIDPEVEE